MLECQFKKLKMIISLKKKCKMKKQDFQIFMVKINFILIKFNYNFKKLTQVLIMLNSNYKKLSII